MNHLKKPTAFHGFLPVLPHGRYQGLRVLLQASYSSLPGTQRRLSSSLTLPSHDSLSTFLDYTKRNSLSRTSSLYRGTIYEYTCLQALTRLGFRLTRTGGRSDAGIDLQGLWHLPTTSSIDSPGGSSSPLKVIVQCKALKAKAGPNLVRELEGAFAGAPAEFRAAGGSDMIGVLCATRDATKGVREAVKKSRRGVIWVMIESGYLEGSEEPVSGTERGKETGNLGNGVIRQVMWNDKVAQMGAEGLGVQVEYAEGDEVGAEGRPKGTRVLNEIVLTWEGKVWRPSVQV
ncbi:hypothetical protein MMC25_002945 [Agyrium rufum]|nr:hypothetical protein [Agyrium rufum]